VLIVSGVLVLVYVLAQYASMYRQQQQLARAWAEQQAPRPDLAHVSSSPRSTLTRILIPKIKLDAVVVEGTSRKQLLAGPGHMEATAQPGDIGNAVITAHRDTFFRHIYELNKGDVVELQRNGAIYRYEVTSKRVVDPSDTSVLRANADRQLTLITCYPTYFIGPAPERLVVFARLQGEAPGEVTAAVAGHP
jgi:sortase A